MENGGLSPRVRGNHRVIGQSGKCRRSIPACAGEPPPAGLYRRGRPVYPRVCGGTPGFLLGPATNTGLSPRVRGNPRADRGVAQPARSIPACAGEPLFSALPSPASGVYPRVCGGTRPTETVQTTGKGLSPRVRGNLGPGLPASHGKGSIPACAGEPSPPVHNPPAARVYPRVCGGTRARPRCARHQ